MSAPLNENINNIYFEGFYKDIWKSLIPEKMTLGEVAFMQQEGNLEKGEKVLDIMCGYGRHSIELARNGYRVTAVDNLGQYMEEIRGAAITEGLPIEIIQDDVTRLILRETYDMAICMGNSICFFEYDDILKLFSNISAHLKKNGLFIINTWSIAEIAIRQFQEKTWGYVGSYKMLSESKYLLNPSRIETDSIIIADDGKMEEKKAIDYIFSYREMEVMLNSTGFSVKEAYSIPGKKKYNFGDPRIYIVAEKQ